MKSRISFKFILYYIAIAAASFVIVSVLCSNLTYKKLLSQNADHIYNNAASIANTYGNRLIAGSISLADMQKELMPTSIALNSDIMLISYDGNILLNTFDASADSVPFDATDSNSTYSVSNFYGLYSSDRLWVSYPIEGNYKIIGYIVICMPMSEIRSSVNDIFNYHYITLGVVLIFFSLLFISLKKNITNPIGKINKISKSYAKGDFSERINLGSSDELGQLAGSLDYMASEIENFNTYQRRLIANVSHDFRSPLTSIKGYLEAMLDGTIPPEMHERYLGIVLTETERLTKLTGNLLTLNNLDDRGMRLETADFDVVELIKKTIETFEGTCAKKHLKFSLVFSAKVLSVNADHDKIQQVIYNLIDNAIKFSNNDSSIIISATERNDKIMVSVKDFGIGIPKDSLSKIWERFYKTDLSRGKDKKGTGLGLSIVKDIINAHKEYIDVVSTEGIGTEFTFALPKSSPQRGLFSDITEES